MSLRAMVNHWKFVASEHLKRSCYSWRYFLNSNISLIVVIQSLWQLSRENTGSNIFISIHPYSRNMIFSYVKLSLLSLGAAYISTQNSVISPQLSPTRNCPKSSQSYLDPPKDEVYNISFALNASGINEIQFYNQHWYKNFLREVTMPNCFTP